MFQGTLLNPWRLPSHLPDKSSQVSPNEKATFPRIASDPTLSPYTAVVFNSTWSYNHLCNLKIETANIKFWTMFSINLSPIRGSLTNHPKTALIGWSSMSKNANAFNNCKRGIVIQRSGNVKNKTQIRCPENAAHDELLADSNADGGPCRVGNVPIATATKHTHVPNASIFLQHFFQKMLQSWTPKFYQCWTMCLTKTTRSRLWNQALFATKLPQCRESCMHNVEKWHSNQQQSRWSNSHVAQCWDANN